MRAPSTQRNTLAHAQPATSDAGRAAAGPRQGRLTALSATLNAALPVQLLRNAMTGQRVNVQDLDTRTLYQLADSLSHGNLAGALGYRFDAGDFDLIRAEIARREPNEPMTMEDHLEEAGVALDEDGNAMEDGSDTAYVPGRHDDMIAHLTTEGRRLAGLDTIRNDASGQERELREWGERSLVGTMGEFSARTAMQTAGQQAMDLNSMSLNFSGLDHISNDPTHPFEQTKLHISHSTANVGTYLAHAGRAGLYAIKGVRALKKHEGKIRAAIDHGFQASAPMQALLASLDLLEGTSDDDIDGSDAHAIVTQGMAFSVPADIYDSIPVPQRGPFRRLGMTVADFRQVIALMPEDFTQAKPSGSKGNPDDDEYMGNS